MHWLAFNRFDYTNAICQTLLYKLIRYNWNSSYNQAFIESECYCKYMCGRQHVVTTSRVDERVNMYTARLGGPGKKWI